jgi:hypothetical protein
VPTLARVALVTAGYVIVVFAAVLAFVLQYGIEGDGRELGYVYLAVSICVWAFAVAEWWAVVIPGLHFLGYEGAWKHLTTDGPISYSALNPVEEYLLAAGATLLGVALARALAQLRGVAHT